MRFGPTSLKLTSVLAKGLHRPKFRSDLRVSEQVFAGELSYMIKVPEFASFARATPYQYELLQLFDGSNTAAEVAQEMTRRYPSTPLTELQALEFINGLDPNMCERSFGERNLAVLERIREERKNRIKNTSVLYFTLYTWDSDPALDRIYPYLRWCFTPGFIVFSIVLFAWMTGIVINDYARIWQDTLEFFTLSRKSFLDLCEFWVLFFVILGIHEFGHGLTCKHFGGSVPSMGVMLIYFNPAFFTDCADMCLFPETSQRMWTIFAGLWIEMLVCAAATIAWAHTVPGSALNDLCYKVLLFAGLTAVFFNLNPLVKWDGYFVLSQILQMDSLSEDSFSYLKACARKYLLRQEIELPVADRRKRRIFLRYSIASLAYSVFTLWILVVLLKNLLTGRFGTTSGYLLTGVVLYLFLGKKVRKALPQMVADLRAAKVKLMVWKMSRRQWLGAVALATFLIVPFTPNEVSTEFLLEPGARADVRAPVPGIVAQVLIAEGEPVEAGAVLAVMRNPGLETRVAEVARQMDRAKRSLLAAQDRRQYDQIAEANQEYQRLETGLTEARAQVAGLTLRAPFDGTVVTPVVEQKVGQYLNPGDLLTTIVNRGEMRARVLVHDWQLQDVREGATVRLKVRSYPLQTFRGRVEQILPAATLDRPPSDPQKLERYGQELSNYFAVVLEISNPDGKLREGMTGTAKIYGKYNPLIWRGARSAWRWLRSQIF